MSLVVITAARMREREAQVFRTFQHRPHLCLLSENCISAAIVPKPSLRPLALQTGELVFAAIVEAVDKMANRRYISSKKDTLIIMCCFSAVLFLDLCLV